MNSKFVTYNNEMFWFTELVDGTSRVLVSTDEGRTFRVLDQPGEYVKRLKASVGADLRRRPIVLGAPMTFRSMGLVERKLRLFAGSGWNGEHPTGYGWARALLAVGERLWWK